MQPNKNRRLSEEASETLITKIKDKSLDLTLDEVRDLVEHKKADVNTKSGIWSVLMHATTRDCNPTTKDIIAFLVSKGADKHYVNESYCVLSRASMEHKPDILEILMDENTTQSELDQALYQASLNGNMESVEMLLNKGAAANLIIENQPFLLFLLETVVQGIDNAVKHAIEKIDIKDDYKTVDKALFYLLDKNDRTNTKWIEELLLMKKFGDETVIDFAKSQSLELESPEIVLTKACEFGVNVPSDLIVTQKYGNGALRHFVEEESLQHLPSHIIAEKFAHSDRDISSEELMVLSPKIVNKYISTKISLINDVVELGAFKERYLDNQTIVEKISNHTKLFLEVALGLPQNLPAVVARHKTALMDIGEELSQEHLFKDNLSAQHKALLAIITYDRLTPKYLNEEVLSKLQQQLKDKKATDEANVSLSLNIDQESVVWTLVDKHLQDNDIEKMTILNDEMNGDTPCVSPTVSDHQNVLEKGQSQFI